MAIQPGKVIKPSTPAKSVAKGATLARNDDDALKAPPRTDDAARSKPGGGSSLDVINAPAAASAAPSAVKAKEAASQPLERSTSDPGKEERPVTTEASTELSDRLNEGLDDMLDRAPKEVLGKDTGAGEQDDGTEASRDSGKGALQSLVDEAFPVGDSASGSAGTGSMGTPQDLGVTGAIGAKADLSSGSGAGLDVFDVSASGLKGSTAASGSSDELGLLGSVLSAKGPSDKSPGVADAPAGSGGAGEGEQTVVDGEPEDTVPSGTPVDDESTQEDTIQVDEFIPSLRQVVDAVEQVAPYIVTGAIIAGAAAAAAAAPAAAIPAAAAALLAVTATEEAPAGGGKTPDASDPGPEGSDTGGWEDALKGAAWRVAGQQRLGLGQGGSGDIDPAEGGTAEDVPGGPAPTPLEAGLVQKAIREFLVGQPAGAVVSGGGSLDLGRLPGNSGDVDPGDGYTGAWTSDTRTESESEALDSFGGSGLTIADARRKDDDDDEEEDDSDDES